MPTSDATQPGPIKPIRTRTVPHWLLQSWLMLTCALAGLVVMTVLAVASYQVLYRDKIHRGVRVGGIKLDGLNRSAAQAALADHFADLDQIPWELRDGQQAWRVTSQALGIWFDAAASVEAAYTIGRSGSLAWNLGEQIRSATRGAHVAPVVLYDETASQRYLAGLAGEIYRPVRDASLTINGLEIRETPPQVGRRLDIETTLTGLRQAVGQVEQAEIELVVVETLPRVIDASIAHDRAQAIVSEPLTLYVESDLISGTLEAPPATPGPWHLSREELAAMLLVSEESVGEDGSVRLDVSLDPRALGAYLAPINQEISQSATSARFIFDDDTRQLAAIAPSTDGLELNVAATSARINQAVTGAEREVPLALQVTPAEFNESVTAAELGITELVASSTSYFAGSSAGRANNVQIAASKFHGILIQPGESFSFNQWLGEVSEEEGYDESLIIFGNETIPDVGGGVCQVSTTAFRTAFWAGYPITERWAHAYRVGYYEQGNQPVGTDATVYSPLVDLKFVNDTPHHLLIETYVNLNTYALIFKFYSTSVGRVVEMEGPVVTDVIEHGDPVYKEDAGLELGEIKQVEWATNGLTAVVTRVIRDAATDEVLERKDFKSKFRPWNAVYLVGPGTEVPGHDVIRLEEQGTTS